LRVVTLEIAGDIRCRARRILGEDAVGERDNVEYFGGANLTVASSYLRMDDHALADRVLAAFDFRPIIKNKVGAGAHGL
jgi:hypothetical protein